MLRCVIFEDEHLLVINKPAGINTHAPSPYAGEGIYDWLRNRELRWASLSIIHRLDKETSGVMVFGKTILANRSLTEQFTQHSVRKKYVLATDRAVPKDGFTVKSSLVRAGEKYVSRPLHAGAEAAETRFQIRNPNEPHVGDHKLVEAAPLTGRTHQIRVHAASSGFPILGDVLYGGSSFSRVCLHATELILKHPVSGLEMTFQAPVDFNSDTRLELRQALVDFEQTDAFRVIHGASDGWPDWYVDRLGDYLLSQSEQSLDTEQKKWLDHLMGSYSLTGAYHKKLKRKAGKTDIVAASPQYELGKVVPGGFVIRENGVKFEVSFNEGYSMGLFLDQRDNRRRLLTGYITGGFQLFNPVIPDRRFEILNVFSYTCGFSVCAALAGARVTSVDLSRKYLDWGKRNFALNNIDPDGHDFIYGDAFDWLRLLAKKKRLFDAVILDPPTFSHSKEHGAFRAEKDFGKLVTAALPLIKSDGILFACSNAAAWPSADFVAEVEKPIRAAHRKILQRHYSPQPPDFPLSRAEPAYLKTFWLRVT